MLVCIRFLGQHVHLYGKNTTGQGNASSLLDPLLQLVLANSSLSLFLIVGIRNKGITRSVGWEPCSVSPRHPSSFHPPVERASEQGRQLRSLYSKNCTVVAVAAVVDIVVAAAVVAAAVVAVVAQDAVVVRAVSTLRLYMALVVLQGCYIQWVVVDVRCLAEGSSKVKGSPFRWVCTPEEEGIVPDAVIAIESILVAVVAWSGVAVATEDGTSKTPVFGLNDRCDRVAVHG
jgi:hypothetical protein